MLEMDPIGDSVDTIPVDSLAPVLNTKLAKVCLVVRWEGSGCFSQEDESQWEGGVATMTTKWCEGRGCRGLSPVLYCHLQGVLFLQGG